MTPAIQIAKRHKTPHKVHEYQHDANCDSYGLEAAQKLGINPQLVFKTLVVQLDNLKLAVGVIPAARKLNMKQLAKAAGVKKAQMATRENAERSTGYILGGISPLGQKKALKTFIDSSAQQFPTIFVSAGRRGLEIELSPLDLSELCQAKFSELCRPAD